MSGRRALAALGASMVLALAACLGDGEGPHESADWIDDRVTTERVVAALRRADQERFAEVRVATREGVVHLSGRVPSAEAAERAAEIARSSPRVSGVETDLEVEGEDGRR